MAIYIHLTAVALLVALSGCGVAGGGGGSVHTPPATIEYGRVTPLRLELSVFEGSAKRYTAIRCHYRTEKARAFTFLDGKIESEAGKRMFVVFELPAFSHADGAFAEYYFDMKLDGHSNVRDVERVPLK